MRMLFEMDAKDYDSAWEKYVRPSVRAIIARNGKIAMVHSLKYDYYKFPGGGIEEKESRLEALCRETAEEAGLTVLPESVKEYGLVRRCEKSDRNGTSKVFVQDNYYYLCEVRDEVLSQELDDYEADERFTLEWVLPQTAIDANRKPEHGPKSKLMIEREARVLEILLGEGYFG